MPPKFKAPEDRKTALLTMRFLENEIPQLIIIAKEKGHRNLSEYIRALLREDIRNTTLKNKGLRSII